MRNPAILFSHRAAGRVGTLAKSGVRATSRRTLEIFCGSRTCKPNSVRRIAPAGRSFLWAAHYCAAQATYPEVVAHRAGTRPRPKPAGSLPIWSCSVWGLPCPPHYCDGGALLPHLFTLTPALPPGRYIFCGTFRRTGLEPGLPDVIRHTALRSSDFPPSPLDAARATVRSSCQQFIVADVGRQSSDVRLRRRTRLRPPLPERVDSLC